MKLMKVRVSAVVLCGFFGGVMQGQTPVSSTGGSGQLAGTPGMAPSVILRPALEQLQQTVSTLHTDKWKVSGSIREETEGNLKSIKKDVEGNLPGLLAAADAAQDSVAKVLPAFRNVEALYDVVLRVAQVARLSAPTAQSESIDKAMSGLDGARRSLGERMQASAVAQERQVSDLRVALKTAQSAAAPVPCAAPVDRKKAKKKS